MSKLTDQLRQKIETEQVKQTPAWAHRVATGSLVFLGLLFLGLGVIAWGLIWYFGLNLDVLEIIKSRPKSAVKMLWLGLPALWLVVFGFSVVVASYIAQHTRTGYRWSALRWVLLLLIPQIVGGFLLQHFRMSERIEQRVESRLPFYEPLRDRRDRIFQRPEDGMIMGEITKVISETEMEILNPRENETWRVTLPESDPEIIKEGNHVLIRGEVKEKGKFKAERVRPMPRRGGQGRQGRPPRPRFTPN